MTGRDAEEDYSAALEQVASDHAAADRRGGLLVRCGDRAAVGLRDPRVSELILIAPPVGMLESLSLDDFRGPIHVIVGGRDEFAPLDGLSQLLEGLPNANLDVIPGRDHFFSVARARRDVAGALVRTLGFLTPLRAAASGDQPSARDVAA